MSRLDRHVIAIQNRLALGRFLQTLAVTSLVFAAVVWLAILVDRLTQIRLPRADIWFWAGVGIVVVGSIIYALVRRPSRHDAAVLIDQRLGLKEKFSTALYARGITDPFAKAAVTDAERTADHVSLRKRFPLHFPKAGIGTIAMVLLALLTTQMSQRDLFGKEERRREQIAQMEKQEQVRKVVEDAIAQVQAIPPAAADQEAINLALRDLEEMLTQPIKDPEQARRTATRALQDVEEAIKQQIRQSGKYAAAQSDARLYRSMSPPQDQKGPVADAHRAMTKGDFAQAVAQLKEAVEKFDQMDEQAKQETVDQMKAMAQQLSELANNPQAEQQLQQQLQQMGASQEQAEQMAKQMQAAARGDQQAQQQLAQQAQQMMEQLPAEQQQAMQQMMQQMQAQANSQAQAQAMAQAAQQMAQAMEQQAGQQQAAQAGAQDPQAGQEMADAQQQMMEQLQQMQAMQQDAEQVAAAQAAAAAAAQAAADQMNQGQQQQGGGNQPGQWQGEWGRQENQGQANNGGRGHAPEGFGGVRDVGLAPGAFQQETAQSQEDEKGRVLAAWYVKDESIKGEARVELREVLEAARNEATDEVDQERISLQSQRVVRDYFNSMERDLE